MTETEHKNQKTVLITGAGGTWGQEFTKQLLAAGHKVIGIGRDEKTMAEYARKFPEATVKIGDFADIKFKNLHVDLLIHGAAYKHINLCEVNPVEAIENNVTKTVKLYEEAKRYGVKICFISTDKAVAPYSVYGMTKALGERLTWHYGGLVARAGNIAGSNGSVIHIWREAIIKGQPLKVTDMNMERYFIRVEDAVELSWQGFQEGKRLTLIDKGGKVKISDLILRVIKEAGYQSIEEYEPGIEIVGMRADVERLSDDITWEFDKKYLEG